MHHSLQRTVTPERRRIEYPGKCWCRCWCWLKSLALIARERSMGVAFANKNNSQYTPLFTDRGHPPSNKHPVKLVAEGHLPSPSPPSQADTWHKKAPTAPPKNANDPPTSEALVYAIAKHPAHTSVCPAHVVSSPPPCERCGIPYGPTDREAVLHKYM